MKERLFDLERSVEMSDWSERKLAKENEGLQGLISRNRKRCVFVLFLVCFFFAFSLVLSLDCSQKEGRKEGRCQGRNHKYQQPTPKSDSHNDNDG